VQEAQAILSLCSFHSKVDGPGGPRSYDLSLSSFDCVGVQSKIGISQGCLFLFSSMQVHLFFSVVALQKTRIV
jgi:hypothetical protein